jgi:hypothetical protein
MSNADQPENRRPIKLELLLGLLFLPVVTIFFLVRPGYSALARLGAICWTAFWVGMLFLPRPAPPELRSANQSPPTDQVAHPESPPALEASVQPRERAMGNHAISQDEFNRMGAQAAQDFKRCGGPCPADNRSETDKAMDVWFGK